MAVGWLGRDCKRQDEVNTDKVLGLMDGQSQELDVRMDEGRGEFNTDKQNERQRGIAC